MARGSFQPATYDLRDLTENELDALRYGLGMLIQVDLKKFGHDNSDEETERLRVRAVNARNLLALTNEMIVEKREKEAEPY